ncbi:MAG: hypothetical protein COA43_11765 [Robiginitomaculum sp.]|nr:MAG: hypothetical protein COA43_11765 [Robiginitomaculum sp.]
MKIVQTLVGIVALSAVGLLAFAHDDHGDATYLANEAILISQGDVKVLFDPFFPTGFGTYLEVPSAMKAKIMAGAAPFDSVDAVFVSHVHPDHFDVSDMVKYMKAHPSVHLFISAQGVEMMQSEMEDGDAKADAEIFKRITGFALKYKDAPQSKTVGKIKVDVVRIPHAGWPSRADVSNLVFRVTLDNGVTVMHMGDADADDTHFKPHNAHWQARNTDRAFPPYWFFGSEVGNTILTTRINAKASTGIHVPIKIPTGLSQSGYDYFSKPGESRVILIPKDQPPKDQFSKDKPHE